MGPTQLSVLPYKISPVRWGSGTRYPQAYLPSYTTGPFLVLAIVPNIAQSASAPIASRPQTKEYMPGGHNPLLRNAEAARTDQMMQRTGRLSRAQVFR